MSLMNNTKHTYKLSHGFKTLLKLIEAHEASRSALNGKVSGKKYVYELKTDVYKSIDIAFWQTLLDMCDRLDLSNYEITPEHEMWFISARETIRLGINDADINKKIKMSHSYNGEHEISPAYVIREVLSLIKDLQDPDRWPQIEFLKIETELHKTISADLDEVVNSLRVRNWKSATVVSASIIEAICSWWVNDQANKKLADLLRECRKQGLFLNIRTKDVSEAESFYQSALCAKNYRNLIHAAKAKRTETQCDEGTAHQAYGVLLRVLDAMSNKPQPA
jgi:hypothetical protein